VNPIGAKVPQGTVLAGGELARFRDQKAHIDALLSGKAPRVLAVADTGVTPASLRR